MVEEALDAERSSGRKQTMEATIPESFDKPSFSLGLTPEEEQQNKDKQIVIAGDMEPINAEPINYSTPIPETLCEKREQKASTSLKSPYLSRIVDLSTKPTAEEMRICNYVFQTEVTEKDRQVTKKL